MSAKGVPLAVGNAPNYFSGIRGPWYYNEDIGLLKKFPLSEKRWLQLRADAFKAFNRQQRGNPVTNIDNPLFGRIVSTISGVAADDGPRVIQLEGRIYF